MVHFECTGKPFTMLLDLIKVAKSHTSMNLGIAFVNVLKKFGIEDKVSVLKIPHRSSLTSVMHDADTRHNW